MVTTVVNTQHYNIKLNTNAIPPPTHHNSYWGSLSFKSEGLLLGITDISAHLNILFISIVIIVIAVQGNLAYVKGANQPGKKNTFLASL